MNKLNSIKLPLLLLAFIIMQSCTTQNKNQAVETTPAPTSTTTDSIPFPIYLSFDEFEPYLQKSNDTTYVINFWATWCSPCVKELPYFEKLIVELKGKPAKVLLVSMDFPKDIKKKLIPFVAEKKLQKSVIALADLDYDSWIDKVSTEWDGAIPFTLIYNSKNRKVKLGELDSYEDLEKLVTEML